MDNIFEGDEADIWLNDIYMSLLKAMIEFALLKGYSNSNVEIKLAQ